MKPKFEVGEIVLNNLTQQLWFIEFVSSSFYTIRGLAHSRGFLEVNYSSHSKAFNKVLYTNVIEDDEV